MTNNQIAPIFAALSDSTRFAVVERLCKGPASVSELQAPFSMATPTFLRHLKVLEGAGLVVSEKRGRVRTVALKPDALMSVETWVQARRHEAESRLDRLQTFLEQDGES